MVRAFDDAFAPLDDGVCCARRTTASGRRSLLSDHRRSVASASEDVREYSIVSATRDERGERRERCLQIDLSKGVVRMFDNQVRCLIRRALLRVGGR